jgi:Uma2 family endonuclease
VVKLTYADFVNLPDDKRYEIIDGELYLTPTPHMKHQRVLGNLFGALYDWAKPEKLGQVFFARLDVVLSDMDIVEPDLIFVSAARLDIIVPENIRGVPDLLVEVLTEQTRNVDETVKLKRYEHFSVPEYWIADPDADTIRIHRHTGRRYEAIDVTDTITSPLLPGFSLPLSEVFAE